MPIPIIDLETPPCGSDQPTMDVDKPDHAPISSLPSPSTDPRDGSIEALPTMASAPITSSTPTPPSSPFTSLSASSEQRNRFENPSHSTDESPTKKSSVTMDVEHHSRPHQSPCVTSPKATTVSKNPFDAPKEENDHQGSSQSSLSLQPRATSDHQPLPVKLSDSANNPSSEDEEAHNNTAPHDPSPGCAPSVLSSSLASPKTPSLSKNSSIAAKECRPVVLFPKMALPLPSFMKLFPAVKSSCKGPGKGASQNEHVGQGAVELISEMASEEEQHFSKPSHPSTQDYQDSAPSAPIAEKSTSTNMPCSMSTSLRSPEVSSIRNEAIEKKAEDFSSCAQPPSKAPKLCKKQSSVSTVHRSAPPDNQLIHPKSINTRTQLSMSTLPSDSQKSPIENKPVEQELGWTSPTLATTLSAAGQAVSVQKFNTSKNSSDRRNEDNMSFIDQGTKMVTDPPLNMASSVSGSQLSQKENEEASRMDINASHSEKESPETAQSLPTETPSGTSKQDRPKTPSTQCTPLSGQSSHVPFITNTSAGPPIASTETRSVAGLPSEQQSRTTSMNSLTGPSLPVSASTKELSKTSSRPRLQSAEAPASPPPPMAPLSPNVSPLASSDASPGRNPGTPTDEIEVVSPANMFTMEQWDTQSVSSDIIMLDYENFPTAQQTCIKSMSEPDEPYRTPFDEAGIGSARIRCPKSRNQFHSNEELSQKSSFALKCLGFMKKNSAKEDESHREDSSKGNSFPLSYEGQASNMEEDISDKHVKSEVIKLEEPAQKTELDIFTRASFSMRERVAEVLVQQRRMRGLCNNGNTCFINVILQSLISCDPFRRLALGGEAKEGMLLHKFTKLAWEMTAKTAPKGIVNEFLSPVPLMPKWMFGIFKPSTEPIDDDSGTQEDAEEFLSFILNKLHEEAVASRKGKVPGENLESCNDGWQTGVQGQRFVETNISKIFGGSSVSEVRRTSQKPSLTEASFFSLGLDVDLDSVNSVTDALRNYCASEVISDIAGKDGERVKTEKQNFLTETPTVLILHLKRFAYETVTFDPIKVQKDIFFPVFLDLPGSIMREKESRAMVTKKYELVAVVTHLGYKISGGHYFCDVRFKKRDGSTIWVKCDDETVKEVPLAEVLRRKAYVLFYCAREDYSRFL